MSDRENAFISRHADKGSCPVDQDFLRSNLSAEDAKVALSTLKSHFSDMRESPLTSTGIERSLRLGDELFDLLPDRAVVVSAHSTSDRSALTMYLAMKQVVKREKVSKIDEDSRKNIDCIVLNDDLVKQSLEDTDSDKGGWNQYGKPMMEDGLDQDSAVAALVEAANKGHLGVEIQKVFQKEEAGKYREVISKILSDMTTEDTRNSDVPIILFAVGHSEPLAQFKYEHLGEQLPASESPAFCELFEFDKDGRVVSTKGIEL